MSTMPLGRRRPKKRSTKVVHPPPQKTGHDKRKELRRIVHHKRIIELNYEPVQFSRSQSANIVRCPGSLLDVSVTGLGIFSANQIPIGTKVRLSFADNRNPYSLIAQVMWCAEIPSANNIFKTPELSMKWRVGLMFLDGENQEDLDLYIKNLDSF